MKEEFDLSKKLRGSKNYPYFDLEDVEEFIRLLKDFEIYNDLLEKGEVWNLGQDELCDAIDFRIKKRIDKLAGKELSGVKE